MDSCSIQLASWGRNCVRPYLRKAKSLPSNEERQKKGRGDLRGPVVLEVALHASVLAFQRVIVRRNSSGAVAVHGGA
eukprot:754630-Rhodomonas_salina.1